jgi:hypothetical protein
MRGTHARHRDDGLPALAVCRWAGIGEEATEAAGPMEGRRIDYPVIVCAR